MAPDSEEVARRIFETNFFAVLRMSQAFAPVLKANGGGALLNVLSVASWVNGGELAAYSASKSADRKSTRLNSSHLVISYAVFCLKKKKNISPYFLHWVFIAS